MNAIESRREFVCNASIAVAAGLVGGRLHAATAQSNRTLFSAVGICSSIDRAAELRDCGAEYLVERVERLLIPDRPDSEFESVRATVAASPLRVLGCNNFLRGTFRCVGPDADHERVLAFCEVVFRRLRSIGGEFVVFGSNTARQIPDTWRVEDADEQMTDLLLQAGSIAKEHGIVVLLKNLRLQECNYLNTVPEVVGIVSAVDHPNVRALADLYHMAWMGEDPAALKTAASWLAGVELAEKQDRTPPGVAGDDFRPYFSALAAGGYAGQIDIESAGNPHAEQLRTAFETIRQQAAEAVAGPS